MSKILAEQLLSGITLGDDENKEYIYLPGGELGSENPYCIFEKNGERLRDLPLEDAVTLAKRLHLIPIKAPKFSK
ncbi:MAG TPA: hypothetical protein IAB06_07360 [Candidatus Avacidaminococcus intestinavium]|uniref:Uncharacterized protein n=1 Tax=Candidatus Avacidaminococcus intestinavium TaxID=2840684 RepID=A0A9D1MQZ4_9FIRM|nr:hypothetical protein [Candidatus Avacidaminococcus intestinavium]